MTSGESFDITCRTIKAHPAASIQWYIDDDIITSNVNSRILWDINGKKDTVSELSIIPNRNDFGKKLKCESNHDVQNNPQTIFVNIIVQYSAVICNDTLDESSADQGQNATIICASMGYPIPDIKWYTWTYGSKVELMSDTTRVVIIHEPYGVNKTIQSTLYIQNVIPEVDHGVYTCHASNIIGSDNYNITLAGRIEGEPDSPTNVSTTGISWDSVNITWDIGYNGGSSQWFHVSYKQIYINDFIRSNKVEMPPYHIDGLNSSTEYEIHVTSENVIALSEPSKPIIFKTTDTMARGRHHHELPERTSTGYGNSTIPADSDINVATYENVRPKLLKKPTNDDSVYASLNHDGKENIYMKAGQKLLEFRRNDISMKSVVSTGRFYELTKCVAWSGTDGQSDVVIKKNIDPLNNQIEEEVSKEIEIMQYISNHSNIVQFLGCCTDTVPRYIVMELQSSDLKCYLHSKRIESDLKDINQSSLLYFMVDIANGMGHLSKLKIIHRYLTTEHILMNSHRQCKISNFSYASDVIDDLRFFEKTQNNYPYQWMSAETLLNRRFSLKSDIWSFGVVMWEIVNLGAVPYQGASEQKVTSMVREGNRMPKPVHCGNHM
ncbi:fibroblast growth factor receptor 2-like [Saccoglossus kowalevskii]|uniref:Mast/stem cell growth factor receptor kita-like n=1 Tax=Saccoglossus kowalevskii TaxID=10224 RepID=A0ABM0M156_SACKO|nr:PREDICTED: mast/stem cell growth factor receptor kita-like [Saccoglossus kowalevskii]